jgi:hypothetical protein
LSERALELLALPEDVPCFILDIGCGSGLSGEVLSDNGHYWTGMVITGLAYRVLKPGGRFMCMEFSHPTSEIFNKYLILIYEYPSKKFHQKFLQIPHVKF